MILSLTPLLFLSLLLLTVQLFVFPYLLGRRGQTGIRQGNVQNEEGGEQIKTKYEHAIIEPVTLYANLKNKYQKIQN